MNYKRFEELPCWRKAQELFKAVGDLAVAVKGLFKAENKVKIIGIRHGEKLFEILFNREEMANALDLGDYYKISIDTRDLNYNKYFIDGEEQVSGKEDYTSNNTKICERDKRRSFEGGLYSGRT